MEKFDEGKTLFAGSSHTMKIFLVLFLRKFLNISLPLQLLGKMG